MSYSDVRWIQRFENFQQALAQLKKFIDKNELNELEEQGLIQSFEYNYELSWNTLKDFYEMQGETEIQGSRDAFRMAFNRGLIQNGDIWMEMIKSRALTTHTYNQKTAMEIMKKIRIDYYPEFINLENKLKSLIR
ncbi:MAG: nucleotidyltransferase substrate binding protein [Candidatus Muiribacteriota bacterium]